MEYIDVTLPNGHVIENVPDTVSREEIADRAIEAGLATEVDFGRDPAEFLDRMPAKMDVAADFIDKVNPFSDPAAVATMAEYGIDSLTRSQGKPTQREAFVKQLYNQFRDAGLSGVQGLPEIADLANRYRQYSRMPSPPVAEGESLVGMAADAASEYAKERREDPAGRFKIDEDYKDTWVTDFGGAMGSMGAFMVAGAAGGPFGFSFAGGTGLSQGRERLEAARAAGQEISQEQEDLGMLLHGFTGLSEMWPVGNILKRIPADVDDLLKNKIVKRIKEIVSSGVFESIQEQSAGIAHDAIEANVYNPDLNVEDSLYGKIVDLDPSAFGDIFTSREATVSAAAGSFSDFAHGLFKAGSRIRRYNINDEAGREYEQNLRDKKDADILRTQEQVSLAKAGQEIDPFIERDAGDRPTPLWEEIDLFADEAAQKAVLVGQGMTASQAEEVVLGPNVSPLGRNPIYRSAVHVAKTIGPSFAATDGAFEIVEGDMVTDEAGNRSRTYEVVIGDQRFGAPLPSYEDAAQFASVLHDQRNATRMSNMISQQIQLFPEELSQEDAGTMASYGVTVLDPDQTSYTASAVNLAGGTTLDRGYDETASIYTQQEKNVSNSKLTVAQKINLDRINQGLSAKNSFTAEEARRALGKNFDNLSDPKINTTLETETYTVKKEANNKIVVVSSDGKTIRGKKLSAVEYQQQLDAGKRPKKDKKYPFRTLRGANAYADTLNKNRGTAAVPDEVLSGDIAAVLESKNISSSVESQEVRSLVGRIIGKETPANIDSLTEGEKKLAYTKIRSLPRFSRPTNLIDFKSPKAAQPVAPEAPLALPAPATAPEVAVIQEALDKAMDQAGLSDVKANINHGLSTVLKDNDGNLVFGIRRRRSGDESVESFGGPGSPIVVDSTADGEAFYSDATGQIFFGLDRLPEGLSTEQKVEAILDILSHEQVHALRALDLFIDSEWTLLRKTAKQRAKSDGQTYFEWAQQNYPELNEVGQIEESIAELVRDYRGGRGAFSGKNKLSGKPKNLLQRMVNFFTGAANFVEGAGFKTFEELASSVESGAVGGRERGQIRTFRETEAIGIPAPDQTFGALEEAPRIAGVRQRPDFSLEDKYSTEDQRRNFLTQRLAFLRGSLERDTEMYPATRRKLEREARKLSDELRGLNIKDKYSLADKFSRRVEDDGVQRDLFNPPEEHAAAVAKGLPMDAKSRKARAIEQGYRGYGGARLQNDFDFTTSVIGDNYRERGSFYGKKAPQYGFNQARKLSQYLADNEIPHKKHVARSGSAYIDVDGEHYLTRDGKKTVSTVFFRFSDHDANYGEPDNDTYLADVFPGGDTVETAIKRLGEVGGVRSVNAAFDPEFREEGVTRGVNVATDGNNNYADLIVSGQKQFETRDTDSLRSYVGKRIGIVETKKGEKAKLVGYATVGDPQVANEEDFNALRDAHLVPEGSKFDIKKGKNKYLYEMIDPQKLERPIDVSDSKGIVARDITKQIQKAQSASEAVPEIRDKYSIRAYHGSPYDFDRFSLDAVGTGEGGTAFGSGIYLAENEDVARNYREELARVRGGYKADGQQLTDDAAALAYRILGDSEETTASVDSVRRALNEWSLDVYGRNIDDPSIALDVEDMLAASDDLVGRRLSRNRGTMYQADIDASPDELLDWDLPLYEQSEYIQNILRKNEKKLTKDLYLSLSIEDLINAPNQSGEGLYSLMRTERRGEKEASEYLRSLGIKGIRYKDALSRDGEGTTSNYVMFDDSIIDIKDKYSRKVLPLEALPKSRGEAKTLPGAEYFKDEAFEMFSLTPKSRDTLIVMSPEDFLSLANEAKEDSEKLKPLQELTEKGQKFGDVPFLEFVHDGEGKAKVTGHEGRHRMMALQEVGVPLVPVRLLSGERGKGRAIRWGSQDPAGSQAKFDYVSPENFPVTFEAQEKAANPNLSIRFPVSVSEAVPEIRGEYAMYSEESVPDKFGNEIQRYLYHTPRGDRGFNASGGISKYTHQPTKAYEGVTDLEDMVMLSPEPFLSGAARIDVAKLPDYKNKLIDLRMAEGYFSYKGNIPREAIVEYDVVKDSPVIKDRYSRRAKSLAKEQGFDVDNIYYHGTASSQPIKKFRSNLNKHDYFPNATWSGEPVIAGHFTINTAFANRFVPQTLGQLVTSEMEPPEISKGRTSGAIYPVYLRAKNSFDAGKIYREGPTGQTTGQLEALLQEIGDDSHPYYREYEKKFISPSGSPRWYDREKIPEKLAEQKKYLEQLADEFVTNRELNYDDLETLSPFIRSAGYDSYIDYEESIADPATGIAIFDPANIKGVFAEYDPSGVPEGYEYADDIMYSRNSTNITPYLKGIEEAPELPKTRGKILKRDVGLYLQERSLEKLKGVPRDLSIAGDRQAIANDLATEAIYEFEKLGNAVGWYDQTVAEMISMMALKHPEILKDRGARTALFVSLAITSQEMAVPKNLRLAAKAYAHFSKTGRFPLIGEGKSIKIMKLNFRKANKLIKKLGSMDLFADFLEETFTVAELNTWLKKHLKGTEIGGENVDTAVFGSAVFGPKIGQGFYTNLRGDFNPVTMDMWFMRTIGRLSGDLMEYDEDLFAKQSKRFIKEKNLQENIAKEIVIEKALETVRQHEKDFKKFRKDYDSGKRKKSEAVKAASTIINSLKNLKDAPTSGGQRNNLRKVVSLAVDKFNKKTGQNIAPAAFQALIWYPEQDLYKALGVSLAYTRSDYAASTKDLLLKEGFSEKEINKRRNRVRRSPKFRSGRVQQKSGKPDRKTARRPARRPSRVVQEEATRTKPVVQDKYSRDSKKVEKAVEENIAAFENRSVTNQIPRFSLTADPEAQYVARNPEKAFEPSPELLDRYARDNGPDLNDEEKKAVDSLSTDPAPRKTPGQTYIDVTDTSLWTYGLTKLKQESVFNYAELERLYVKGDLEIGDPESSAWRALIFADKSRALAADAQRHGAVNYDKQETGIVTTEPFEHNGRTVGGLIDVFTPLYENPYEISLEQLAQSYFIGRRAERLRAEGKKVPGDAEAIATVEELVEGYVNPDTGRPIIIEVYETWQAYNEKTIDFLQASGVLDGEKAQIWRDYSDYVPFYREAEGEADLGGYPSVFSGLNSAVKMAPLKGQERAITMPLLDAVVMNQAMAIDLGLKNIAQQRVIRDMENAGMARKILPGSNEPEVRVVSFRVDGKEVSYTVDNPLVYESLLPLDGGFQMMEKVLGMPASLMRELITRNPSFAAKNILRDTLSSWITSGANYIPILGSLEGLFKGVNALGKFGVVGGFDNVRDPAGLKQTLRKILREKKIKIPKGSRLRGATDAVPLANNFVALWDLLGDLSTASDVATRYAVYKDTLARTGSDAAATLAAVEVINFGRRGRNPYARLFTAATPFLNARYQGLDVLYRSHTGRNLAMMKKDAQPMARTQQILTAATRGAMLAGISAIWWALVSDDDQYKDTPDEIKDLNIIFPTASGAPFLFPLPFEVGVFYWTIPQRILDYYPVAEMFGKEGGTSALELKESAGRFVFGTAEGLVFNPMQIQAISPLVETAMNFDSFKQRNIVPKYIEDASFPEYQRTPYTSELAESLAKALPLPDSIRSPMKLDHLLKGYFPGIGTVVLGLADSLVRSPMVQGDNTKVIPGQGFNLKSADWWDYPFVRRFFRDKYDTGALQDFYTLKRTLNQAMKSLGNENLSLEEKQGIYISYAHLLGASDEYPSGLKDPIKRLDETLADLRKREREILLSDWPASVKKNQIDDLKNMRDTHNALIHAYKRDANLPASRIHNLEPGEFDRFMEQQEIEHQSEMKRLVAPVYKGRE